MIAEQRSRTKPELLSTPPALRCLAPPPPVFPIPRSQATVHDPRHPVFPFITSLRPCLSVPTVPISLSPEVTFPGSLSPRFSRSLVPLLSNSLLHLLSLPRL